MHSPVFITARFRTGSTMLWNLLRQVDGLRTYYEPCHDNLVEHILGDTPVQESHRGVDSYWEEYRPVIDRLPAVHRNEFGVHRLCLEASDHWPEFEAYLRVLLDGSGPLRPVLQFNRVDFRLPWLRVRFPDAVIVHLCRNPRDQWLSMTRGVPDDRLADPDENTDYDLVVWATSLSNVFPFLVGSHIRHSYERHYLIWKLSYLMGTRCANLSLSFDEDFGKAPEFAVAALLGAMGTTSGNVPRLASGIRPPAPSSRPGAPSAEEFAQMEASCDRLLNRLGLSERFGLVPLTDIRNDAASAWAPFVERAHGEALRLGMVTFSLCRSRYLQTVTVMRELGRNAQNVQSELARRERQLLRLMESRAS